MCDKGRSVKTRIFFSNTMMVLVTLLLFLAVSATILEFYEEKYDDDFLNAGELDRNAAQASALLENCGGMEFWGAAEELSVQLRELGYQLCVIKDNRIIFSNMEAADELDEHFDIRQIRDGETHVYFLSGITAVIKLDREQGLAVYAVAGEYNEYWDEDGAEKSFVLIFLLDGIFCIGVLLLMSQFFTGGLTKRIMRPLSLLSEGARRMGQGNLAEPVVYAGDKEFEEVCGAFNEMQESILEEREKNRRYEQARTDMIAGISHDLRTPLTAIRGAVKGLRDGVAGTPELREKFLDTVYRRTMDMDVLLQRLFYFSKLETGNMPVHMERMDIFFFVQEYVKSEERIIRDRKVRFVCQPDVEPCHIDADPEQMKRIFDNLVENSMKPCGRSVGTRFWS